MVIYASQSFYSNFMQKKSFLIVILQKKKEKKEKYDGSIKKYLVKNDQVPECQSKLPIRGLILIEVNEKTA